MDNASPDFQELIFRGIESDELDYKAHQNWRLLSHAGRCKLVRHLTAFANTKGGYLIIGVGEDDSGCPTLRTGMTREEAASFDPTPVGTFVHQCVEPPIDFTIERPEIHGKRYVVFVVRPFKTLPHVCTRNADPELQQGVFYIRTQEASSRPAYRALELQKLLQRAMRNEREALGRMLRGILYEKESPAPSEQGTVQQIFADTLAESLRYFLHRRQDQAQPGMVLLQFSVTPGVYRPDALAVPDMREALNAAWQLRPDAQFISDGEIAAAHTTPTSLRMLSAAPLRMWQLFDSGLFHFAEYRKADDAMDFCSKMMRFCVEAVLLFSKLYSELHWEEELLTLRFTLSAPVPGGVCALPGGVSSDWEISLCRSVADLSSGGEKHAERLCRRWGERFQISDQWLDKLPELIREYWNQR